MSLNLLASGTLAHDPVERQTDGGKVYATSSMRTPIENAEPVFLSLIAFGPTAQALLALAKGDSIAVAGRGELASWTGRDGEQRHGLKCVVDQLLTPYSIAKKRDRIAAARGEEATT